jgi:two-component system CheB/CheR fusion protein
VPAHVEYELFFRPDGTSFPVEYWVNPILRDGERHGAVCTFIDITERRHAQEHQGLLVRELNHRIKNIFAITSGMIALSARSAVTPKEYAANIRGRFDALALAHELILPNASGEAGAMAQPTDLDTLLRKILSPYTGKSGDDAARLLINGPPVALGGRTVTTFALIVHELATNAAKYGSLSVDRGSVHIIWTCEDNALAMKWEEEGGPMVTGPPKSEGFGTVLSNHSVRGLFEGVLSHNWCASGLIVELSVPLERLSR